MREPTTSACFWLLDINGDSVSAEVDVDIRIVKENNEEVYKGTKTVLKGDFDYYTNQAAGERFLANVRMSEFPHLIIDKYRLYHYNKKIWY